MWHRHNFIEEKYDELAPHRNVLFKISHCSCGATKMLTVYGWRIYKDGKIIN